MTRKTTPLQSKKTTLQVITPTKPSTSKVVGAFGIDTSNTSSSSLVLSSTKSPSFDEFRVLLNDDTITCNNNHKNNTTNEEKKDDDESRYFDSTSYHERKKRSESSQDGQLQNRIKNNDIILNNNNNNNNKNHSSPQMLKLVLITKSNGYPTRTFMFWHTVRYMLLDIPTLLCFVMLVSSYIVRELYLTYYIPIFARVARTNTLLQDEYTYYDRICTQYDISTSNIHDLIVNDTGNIQETVQIAQEQMLTHGGVVISNIISTDLVQQLRKYIEYKNSAIPEEEKYPVSQGYKRVSYGIDASEHTIVSTAIQSIVNNTIFVSLLQSLLGDVNPASAEITAITASYGAPEQAWHMDTKIDGNAVQYARTYSHSYSLFIPLQNTTYSMGPTDICPGTHMCHNDLSDICERTKIGLHQVASGSDDDDDDDDDDNNKYFPIGSAALLNQHVWHRGGKHIDPNGLDRIVFILSFVARPNFNSNDKRQLSRGTYFHQKWNMWGHTIIDLLSNPSITMKQPWSTLKCLGLYSYTGPTTWGYDLITATYMRFMNGQLEYDDLETRLLLRLDQLNFPNWLRGRVLEPDDGYHQSIIWKTFIQETGTKVLHFVQQLTITMHIIWLLAVLSLSSMFTTVVQSNSTLTSRRRRLGYIIRSILYLVLVYCIILTIAYIVWDTIQSSSWGASIQSGIALRRPFPTISDINNNNNNNQQQQQYNHMVSSGKTTFPTRNDILVGTRYDAKFLGSYNHWLEHHPGNVQFQSIIQSRIQHNYYNNIAWTLFTTTTQSNTNNNSNILYKQFRTHLVIEIVNDIMNLYDTKSRFLQQDYRTGDWRIMTNSEIINYIQEIIITNISNGTIITILRDTIQQMIASWRFDSLYRSTYMSTITQFNLWQIKQKLLQINSNDTNSLLDNKVSNAFMIRTVIRKQFTPTMKYGKILPLPVHTSNKILTWFHRPSVYLPSSRSLSIDTTTTSTAIDNLIKIGSLVWIWDDESQLWSSGVVTNTINRKDTTTWYTVAFDDGSIYNVPSHVLQKQQPIVEGSAVFGCFHSTDNDDDDDDDITNWYDIPWDDCYPGRIQRVMASGSVVILFDDGDTYIMKRHRYYIPPYQYIIPPNDIE